jgi:DNA repair exonuclease SbcCD nuclease subunit
LDAIRELGQVALKSQAEFVVVAGDVFDSNQVDRRTVARGLEAMGTIPVPVFLLPGNHDPFDPASVYRSEVFVTRQPGNVKVLEQAGPVEVQPGVELVAAPWPSKRPATDLVADICGCLEPRTGVRILAGHGAVSTLEANRGNPTTIQLDPLREVLASGRLQYVALGDRHSVTEVCDRVWYSGSPEATDFGEQDSGKALVVELNSDSCSVEPVSIGKWHFVRNEFDISTVDELQGLREWLNSCPEKERTVLRLALCGTVTLATNAELDELLDEQRELFAAIDSWASRSDLVVLPSDGDFSGVRLSGFAEEARSRLTAEAQPGQPQAEQARDALGLLYRLARAG